MTPPNWTGKLSEKIGTKLPIEIVHVMHNLGDPQRQGA